MRGRQKFPRSHRLLKAAEFEMVLNYQCAVRSRYFVVMGRPNDLGHPRLGMIVSKRLFSRSVDRNRMRRKIREVFRLSAKTLPALDLVIRPHSRPQKEELVTDLYAAIEAAVNRCSAC